MNPDYTSVIQVQKDLNLIEQIKASFLDILQHPIVTDMSLRTGILINDDDMDLTGIELDHDYFDTSLDPIEECEELDSLSLDNSTNKVAGDQVDDSFMMTGGASQVQSWHFIDEDFSNCVHNSINSSDCVSQTFSKAKKPCFKTEKLNDWYPTECARLQSLDARSDDVHYQSVISTLLKSSDQLGMGNRIGCCKKDSSFNKWNEVGLSGNSWLGNTRSQSQVMLKKALLEVSKMHNNQNYNVQKIDPDEVDTQQQNALHEKFTALESLVPISDKVSLHSLYIF